jgi:hypothetical protein
MRSRLFVSPDDTVKALDTMRLFVTCPLPSRMAESC